MENSVLTNDILMQEELYLFYFYFVRYVCYSSENYQHPVIWTPANLYSKTALEEDSVSWEVPFFVQLAGFMRWYNIQTTKFIPGIEVNIF